MARGKRQWIVIGAVVAVLFGSCLWLGARRYPCGTPSSEGRNTLGAIVRGAQASFEGRPRAYSDAGDIPGERGKLCPSVAAVPGTLPHPGERYQPHEADFDEWECLRFGLTQPHRFRYSYHSGHGYLGPSRGLPDPGPSGFETAAEAACADGKTTLLFTRVGAVAADGTLTIDRTLHSTHEDPDECLSGEADGLVGPRDACR